MWISQFGVQHVRIIEEAELRPSPGLNVISGENGSGKSSLLEAIHLLSLGRSFRTANVDAVISRGQSRLRVSARVARGGDSDVVLGMERGRGEVRARIGGREAQGIWEMAEVLPVLAIHPQSHELISGSPVLRRQFLDWGAFHQSPGFMESWRRWRRALEQRNLGLRRGVSSRELVAWNREVGESGELVDAGRRRYLEDIKGVLSEVGSGLAGGGEIDLRYQRGWARELSLAAALREGEDRDRQCGHTQVGPQRADLEVLLGGEPAARVASRGEGKVVAVVLKLAQGRLLRDQTGQAPVVLVDDLASELDVGHRGDVLQRLRELGGQVFVTGIRAEDIPFDGWAMSKMFHVKHGEVLELV